MHRLMLSLTFAALVCPLSVADMPLVPSFDFVLAEIVNARGLEPTENISYWRTERSRSADGEATCIVGALYQREDPRSFRHDYALADASSKNGPAVDELMSRIGRLVTVIATSDRTAEMGMNGKYARIRNVPIGTSRSSQLPFDARAFGLSLIGDVSKGWPLERTAINFLDWGDPDSAFWVTEGVIGYKWGNFELHIDTEKGYWPIYHRLEVRPKGNANADSRVESAASVVLVKHAGVWRPATIKIWNDNIEVIYDIEWGAIIMEDKEKFFDIEQVARERGFVLRQ